MLRGKLTEIRPLEIDDLDLLYEWYNDHDFGYWVCGNWPMATFLRREEIERKFYEEDENRYAIIDHLGDLIGTIGFDQANIPAQSARLFIGIGNQEYWGKGYGSDALAVFIQYLFRQWNFRRLMVETIDVNSRAIACYEKLGFVKEGHLREAYYIEGQYHDAVILGLLKSNYCNPENLDV